MNMTGLMPAVVATALSSGRWAIHRTASVDRGPRAKVRRRTIWYLIHQDGVRYLVYEADALGNRQDHATYDHDDSGGTVMYDDVEILNHVLAM